MPRNWGNNDPKTPLSAGRLNGLELDILELALVPQGPQGVPGPKGDQGPQGVPGPQGLQGNTGPAGAAGTNGTSVTIQGHVPTAANLPTSGNLPGHGWITDNDGHLHVYAGSSFTDAGVVRGPTGLTGPTGAQGPQGVKGDTGPQGVPGPTGATGSQGVKGDTGSVGLTGATGPAGPGGPVGAQGVKGDKGDIGPVGPIGPEGNVGPQGPSGSKGEVNIIPSDLSLASAGGWTADTANTPPGVHTSYSTTTNRQLGTANSSSWLAFDETRIYRYSFDIHSDIVGQVTYVEMGWRTKTNATLGNASRLLTNYTVPANTWTTHFGFIGPGMPIVPPAGTARINPFVYANHANGAQGGVLSFADFRIVDVTEVVDVVRNTLFQATAVLNGSMSAADKAKLDAATSQPTASTLMSRNAAGEVIAKAFFVGGSDPQSTLPQAMTRKDYVDGRTAPATTTTDGSMSAADKAILDAASSTTTGGSLVKRSPAGNISGNVFLSDVPQSASVNSMTRRDYVDGRIDSRTPMSVADYGLNGDGVTSNNTTMQTAVTAAVAAGRGLYWPAGTYLKSVSISGFHTVQHFGPGVVKHGSSLFYVEPTGIQANTLYVSTTGASDNNDGLDAAVPIRTTNKAVSLLPNYGPVLQGFWAVQLSAGTYTDRTVMPAGINSVSPITIRGPIVNHPNVPTAIFKEGYNIGAVAIKLADAKTGFIVSNIKFDGYNGTTSSAGVQTSSTADETYLINCHFVDCYWGATNQNSAMDIKGGIFTRCGYLGDTANNVTPSARNGNGGGYRGLMGARHSIGTQNSGDLLKGPFFYACKSGVFAQETCTGHVDWCVIEDCAFGVNLNVNSRANVDGTRFRRNNFDLRGVSLSHFFISGNTTFGTGVDESRVRVSLTQGSQMTDSNRLFTDISQSYGVVMRLADTKFPNQTINTTGLTTFYTTTLAGGMWRDGLDSTHERKRIVIRIWGELAGTAGTKNLTIRLGTSTVSATFTATEVGNFEAEATAFFTDTATQLVVLKAARHLGTGSRISSNQMTNALTADTAITAEATVAVGTDSVRIDAVDMSWG